MEDPKQFQYFFVSCFLSVCVGLILGGLVNSVTTKIQNDPDDWTQRTFNKALLYLIVQISINILLLSIIIHFNKHFVLWFQLTVSGALFSVLLFTSQKNLVDNVLRLTNIL
jgi:uncharacterized membrane protein